MMPPVFSPLCASKRERGTRFSEPHNGLGAPQARPPERSGATGPRDDPGAPTARTVRRGVGRRGGSAGAKPPGSRPLYGALREFCSRCKRRRIAVGAHGAPARSGAGHGAPASDEPGCGAEPHVSLLFFARRPVMRLPGIPLVERGRVSSEPHHGPGAHRAPARPRRGARPHERPGRGVERSRTFKEEEREACVHKERQFYSP